MSGADAGPAMTTLPPVASVPTLPAAAQAQLLDLLFEPSAELRAVAAPLLPTPYPSWAALIDAVGARLARLRASGAGGPDRQQLDAILGAHPRLGAARVDSAQSRAEQAALQGDADEAAELARLNAAYEAAFPGLRYVVFVAGRGRPAIFADMRQRIARGDAERERDDAAQAMCDIAKDRASKLHQAGEGEGTAA